MFTRITLFALLFSFSSYAERIFEVMAPKFSKVSSEFIGEMPEDVSIFYFTIQSIEKAVVDSKIQYSIDGVTHSVTLDSLSFEVVTKPGKHIFQIYINENYIEMYSDTLEIEGHMVDTYHLYPRWAHIQIEVDKPVIYLYPQVKTNVSVELDVAGELAFTYPEYNDGWKVIANPDGTIELNESTYNYLFWESSMSLNLNSIDYTSGYIIKKNDVLTFLEDKLDVAGFTSKEKADFITYWGPRMIAHDRLFVQFVQNEDCNQYAELDITPKPDHVNRFYMTWMELAGDYNLHPMPQEIKPINRKGFSILEWGGQEIFLTPFNSSTL